MARAARNMSYQMMLPNYGVVDVVAEISGADLIGQGLASPLTSYKVIYALPMMSIKPDKGAIDSRARHLRR